MNLLRLSGAVSRCCWFSGSKVFCSRRAGSVFFGRRHKSQRRAVTSSLTHFNKQRFSSSVFWDAAGLRRVERLHVLTRAAEERQDCGTKGRRVETEKNKTKQYFGKLNFTTPIISRRVRRWADWCINITQLEGVNKKKSCNGKQVNVREKEESM